MRIKFGALLVLFALFALPALAQLSNAEVSASYTGNFQEQAGGFGVTDVPSDSGGVLVNFRYHFNRWSAIETNYAYTRFTQFYAPVGFRTQANVNEATLAYVFTFGMPAEARFKPFLEGGTGALIFSPTAVGSINGALNQDRSVLLYGGGMDLGVTHRLSLRIGYRGLIYKAPDFALPGQVTNATTQMAEPYIGIVFRL